MLLCTISVKAQYLNGYVMNVDTNRPLKGVIVSVTGLNINAESDSIGFWSLRVPIGTYSVQFQLLGYESIIVSEVSVSAGKQRDLSVNMKESLTILEEIVVTPDTRSYGQISRMQINPTQLSHLPGHANDPVRMLTAMPGITNAGDDRNDLVVRGNTSIGVLWRIEGIEIFNPNHYAFSGTSGGAVSLLNKDILGTSYFYTGAFPAEFGNVFSGVFDANFREGNSSKYEFSAEVSNLDVNLIAEGPIPIKKRKSSFVAGLRQSVVPVFDFINKKYRELLGATPDVTDFSFKLASRNKTGAKTVFWGVTGKSDIYFPANTNNAVSLEISNNTIHSSAGLSHQFFIGKKMNIKAVLGMSYLKTDNFSNIITFLTYKNRLFDESLSASTGIISNIKLNKQNLFKGGINFRFMDLNIEKDNRTDPTDTTGHFHYKIQKQFNTANAFVEWQHHFNNRLTMTFGSHYFLFSLNNHYSLEPRISFMYSLKNYHLELALGEYSKHNPIGLYMAKGFEYDEEIKTVFPNQNIGFLKSRQAVLSFGGNLSNDIKYKTELYCQYHYNVAIAKQIDDNFVDENIGFLSSALNLSYNSGDIDQTGIIYDNTGKGYSTGVEGMIYFDNINGFSMNFSGSVFKSMFYCRNGWYNTLFNNRYAFKVFVGKEFKLNYKNRFHADFAINWLGGRRYTPIDCDLSYYEQKISYNYYQYAGKQYSDYFRVDLKASYIINRKFSTHIFSIDLRNLTNNKNIYYQRYQFENSQIINHSIYQIKIFPVISYKLLFGEKK
jgi:hypothetical protein